MPYWIDKVVLVTGGSRGFGRRLAETFAEHGARVTVAARGKELLDEVAAAICSRGGEAHAAVADVRVENDVQRLVDQAADRYGRLDVLVNCAGQSTRGPVLDATPSDFQQLWELNFLATVRCTRAAVPHLLRSRGHLVNIASLAAKTAPRYLASYPASKFPVAAYSQQLRLELAGAGLHVLLVCPGSIARIDAAQRYEPRTNDLPDSARQPGGGARMRAIDPEWLANRVLVACEKRQPELVVPGRARLLFALAQLAPRLGDWLLVRLTGGRDA
jgi:NAD(P)-dependent dehydrogenase (short-subunit alcohol dehydrogenase family)